MRFVVHMLGMYVFCIIITVYYLLLYAQPIFFLEHDMKPPDKNILYGLMIVTLVLPFVFDCFNIFI